MSDKSAKDSLRKELLGRRDTIPPGVRRVKDRMIQERLTALDEFRDADLILFFASFRTEVDTFALMKESLDKGKRIALPKVDRGNHILILYEIKNIDELSAGYMAIPEPSVNTGERRFTINDMDLVIIPGAGFDPAGGRIGYGGGYYDMLLGGMKKNIPVVAPAYEEQIVESVPAEPHDVKIGMIVTDRRVIRCR
ncbi:MAG: 5-formyltetrahydrofolate cyclo-ligase [Nitrospirota bacterium]|nr:5-formyltetrahydrofolate cyclo-ligase [Nitrospirota bacterium]